MTKHNILNVKLSNSKTGSEVVLNLSSSFLRNFNNKINFPQKLLLTDTQVSRNC